MTQFHPPTEVVSNVFKPAVLKQIFIERRAAWYSWILRMTLIFQCVFWTVCSLESRQPSNFILAYLLPPSTPSLPFLLFHWLTLPLLVGVLVLPIIASLNYHLNYQLCIIYTLPDKHWISFPNFISKIK